MSIHDRIRVLIEETNDAYSSCGGTVNADYAEFAALALSEFKHVLRTPGLTQRQLKRMIRTGMTKHKNNAKPQEKWAAFMARHVSASINSNTTAGAV